MRSRRYRTFRGMFSRECFAARVRAGWARIDPPLLILPTSFIADALSAACSDVLLGVHSDSALAAFCSRANIEPVADLSLQGVFLLTYVQTARTVMSPFVKSAAASSSELFGLSVTPWSLVE